ncbi:MAG: type III-B CRISPR module RAMP protein Cmr6, partial [Planctomycetota bacterium]
LFLEKGYGFIDRGPSHAKDLFFHKRAIKGTPFEALKQGMKVQYRVGRGPKGPRATEVRPASEESTPLPPKESGTPRATSTLPRSTFQLISATEVADRHPGLQLDKYFRAAKYDQEEQHAALDAVVNSGQALRRPFETEWLPRQRWMLEAIGALTFEATTASRLTLHLARANALENAGLCLHPIYGFPYLPGSGLKGLASAYAETIWLPEQKDATEARRQIADVFGWAPNAEGARKSRVTKDEPAHAGTVVFHDAWPTSWPVLQVDITNNHHPDYYMYSGSGDGPPPADWDSPNPVYLLTVAPGTNFLFALSKSSPGVPDELIGLARSWLENALVELGAGARTAAGYGYFLPPAAPDEDGDGSRPAANANRPTLDRLDGETWKASLPPDNGGEPPPPWPTMPAAGSRITVTLLEEKTRKGGWKAEYAGRKGAVIASGPAPADWTAGAQIEVTLLSDQPQFAFPPREERQGGKKRHKRRPRH